jgi:hypothetical protein
MIHTYLDQNVPSELTELHGKGGSEDEQDKASYCTLIERQSCHSRPISKDSHIKDPSSLPESRKTSLRRSRRPHTLRATSCQRSGVGDIPRAIRDHNSSQVPEKDVLKDAPDLRTGSMAQATSLFLQKLSYGNYKGKYWRAENVMSTPSERLLSVLPSNARHVFSPLRRHKMDLSRVSIRRWENVLRQRRTRKGPQAGKNIGTPRYTGEVPLNYINLSGIVSTYIAMRSAFKGRAALQLYDTKTMKFLHSKGYQVNDVLAWTRILVSSDANQMVSKFIAMAEVLSLSNPRPLPTFLLLFILRARGLTASSLRLLLDYVMKYYTGQFSGAKSVKNIQTVGLQTAMIMVIRLVRHARSTWPDALEKIALIATKLIAWEADGAADPNRQHMQVFSHVYNRLLTLFAMPTSLRPFLSIPVQQRAQFCLVRKMTEFKAHVPVTREGFRALIKIQLAHKKTGPERKWAEVKALSWPPWKEDLLGIEAESEHLGKTSRAAVLLCRMTEAGYSHLQWEKTAHILAGWDTDGSPTIQTRTLLNREPLVLNADVKALRQKPRPKGHIIWATRIIATRTVKEAWACFKSYEKRCGKQYATRPHNAMLARLLNVKRNDDSPGDDVSLVVPGDGKETWPEPTSPHDFLYVPSDPPSISLFIEIMKKRGLKLETYLLREFLDSAETLAHSIIYLNASRLRSYAVDTLLGKETTSAEDFHKYINTIPHQVVAAFIRLLCRSRASPQIRFALPQVPQQSAYWLSHTADPFVYARNFVAARKPSFSPIWYALFEGFNHRISVSKPQTLCKYWENLLDLLHEIDSLGIELDFGGFPPLGDALEKVIVMNDHIQLSQQQRLFSEAEPKLGCVSICKSLFSSMAYGGSLQSKQDIAQEVCWLPVDQDPTTPNRANLISFPNPAVLHKTIRILGMGQDNSSILTLLRWMHCFAREFADMADELANSKKLTRHTLTAARYFLEEFWRDDDFEQCANIRHELQGGQKELVHEAKAIIEQHGDDWGGWPTDEDLYRYHHINKTKARRLRKSLGLSI